MRRASAHAMLPALLAVLAVLAIPADAAASGVVNGGASQFAVTAGAGSDSDSDLSFDPVSFSGSVSADAPESPSASASAQMDASVIDAQDMVTVDGDGTLGCSQPTNGAGAGASALFEAEIAVSSPGGVDYSASISATGDNVEMWLLDENEQPVFIMEATGSQSPSGTLAPGEYVLHVQVNCLVETHTAQAETSNGGFSISAQFGADDSDGDGLLDSWESEGIDFTNNGSVDLDLPVMGADPLHKDIYVEIDHMSGHGLSQTAIDKVVASFAVAPVPNPDGSGGITLHVDNGPSSNMDPRSAGGSQWGDLSDQDTLTHQDVLGTGGPGDYNWSAFDLIKAGNFSIHREPVFHYVVSGHRFGAASNSRTGISRGVDDGGSDLLVTLASLSAPAEGSGTVDQQAGTLMHELGHNLGLHHGGDDDGTYKANYLSVMNYSFQFGLRRADGGRLLDYSRFGIPLSESALNETSGFGLSPSSPPAAFSTLAVCPGDPAPLGSPSKMELTPLSGPVDWNCNTLADGTVAADINDDGSLTGLGTSTIDWLALIYAGGGIGSLGVEALPETTEMIEPQLEELLLNEQALNGELRPLPIAKPPTTVVPPAAQPTFATVKKCKKGQKLKKVKGKKKCVKKRK
jgi:hypothetical protein